MRTDAIEARPITDPDLYRAQIQLAREMAQFLRRNVVQGQKVLEGKGTHKWSEFPLGVYFHPHLNIVQDSE